MKASRYCELISREKTCLDCRDLAKYLRITHYDHFITKKKRVKKVEDALPFESRRMPADNADVILSVGVRTLRERCDPDRIMMLGFVFYTETTA